MHYHQDNINTLHTDSLKTPYIRKEGTAEKDTAQYGQTMFFTTFHLKTN